MIDPTKKYRADSGPVLHLTVVAENPLDRIIYAFILNERTKSACTHFFNVDGKNILCGNLVEI